MSATIEKVAIYPPIGIARVGNAAETSDPREKSYYLAPEVPGGPADSPGGYKDSKHRIKKQVVRFRVYGLDVQGNIVRELTLDDGADIEWRVHVANRKAAWYQFKNALDLEGLAIPTKHRNEDIEGPARKKLVIDPGEKRIQGRNVSGPGYQLDGGEIFGKKVSLGELRTDGQGRLLFFGGDGRSESRDGSPPTTFANNDGWFDDTSDGPIRAKVTYRGRVLEVEPAFVAVTPPNYGQGLFGVVTMYDVVYDLFVREGSIKGPDRPNFWEHIFPILRNMVNLQWVNSGASMLFGHNSPSNFLDPQNLASLSDPSEESREERERLFAWFRDPESDEYRPAQIPPLYGDAFGDYKELAQEELSVTITQYGWLKKWAEGDFLTEKPEPPVPFDEMTAQEQVESLIRTPLEECLGGPFHPGIELTWTLRQRIMWKKPFRLKVLRGSQEPEDDFGRYLVPSLALGPGGALDGSGPGTLTRWLGIPWQTDESSCLSGYNRSTYLPLPSFWGVRVPNQVLSQEGFDRLSDSDLNLGQRLKHFDYRQDWLRDLSSQYFRRLRQMVRDWWELGIVAPEKLPEASKIEELPSELWVESHRRPLRRDPTLKQVMIAEGVLDPGSDAGHGDSILLTASDSLGTGTEPGAGEESTRSTLPGREGRVYGRDEM